LKKSRLKRDSFAFICGLFCVSCAFLRRISCLALASALCLCGLMAGAQGGKAKAPVSSVPTYARDIKPVLQTRCVVCHSDATVSNPALSGGLSLASYAALQKGVTGAAPRSIYVAGKSADSEIYKRLVTPSTTKLMPKGGPPLPAAQIALFKKWLDAGAPAGDLPKETSSSVHPAANTLPMPANPGKQEVSVATRIEVTPDLRDKNTPKDAALAFALTIGPLPPVTALAYSPDGKQLLVGSYRAVTLWDTTTGKPTSCLTHLPGQVQSLAFRPDGAQFAVAGGMPGAAGEVRVYDAKTLALAGSPLGKHTDVVVSVAWNTEGTKLATGSQDKTARVWEWPSGKELQLFKDHSDAVTRVCFAPDSKSIYTASMDHTIRRYDVEKGQLLRLFSGHNEGIAALAVRPDGKRILSSGTEVNLRWWNTDDGNTTNNNGGHSSAVNEIVFSKDGKLIASASADQTVRIWDANSTGQTHTLRGASDWLYTVAISPDNKFTAGAGADGIVRIWETATERLRLALLAWPTPEKATAPEWAAITPEGFYDASPAWADRLHPLLAGQPLHAPRVADFVHTLRQPESVVKSWQGVALDPAKIPAAPPPVTPKKDADPKTTGTSKTPVAPKTPAGSPTTPPKK
jgi:WD40 repeat protein